MFELACWTSVSAYFLIFFSKHNKWYYLSTVLFSFMLRIIQTILSFNVSFGCDKRHPFLWDCYTIVSDFLGRFFLFHTFFWLLLTWLVEVDLELAWCCAFYILLYTDPSVNTMVHLPDGSSASFRMAFIKNILTEFWMGQCFWCQNWWKSAFDVSWVPGRRSCNFIVVVYTYDVPALHATIIKIFETGIWEYKNLEGVEV